MSDMTLSAILNKASANNTKKLPVLPSSLVDAGNSLLKNMGVAGRGVVQGLVSPITIVSDPLTEFVNNTFGAKQTLPSKAVENALTAIGLPRAETDAQKILESATSGLSGGGLIAKTAQTAAKATTGLSKKYLDTIGKDIAGQMSSGLSGSIGSSLASKTAEKAGASPFETQLAGLSGSILTGKPMFTGPKNYKIISSQRYLDESTVESKLEQLKKSKAKEVNVPILDAGDINGQSYGVVSDKHHTMEAAKRLGLPVVFHLEKDPESLTGERLLESRWNDSPYYDITTGVDEF